MRLMMPFVLRSTYDALRKNADESYRLANHARIEAMGELGKARDRIEDYKREADRSHNELALALGRGESGRVTITTLRGYVTARDVVIAGLEQKIAELRMLGDADQQLIIQESARADEAEKQLAAATKSPAKPPRRSKLTEAIREQATLPGGELDPRLLNHFRARANTLRRQGKKQDEIIEAIGVWQTTERGESAITVDAIVANMSAEAIP